MFFSSKEILVYASRGMMVASMLEEHMPALLFVRQKGGKCICSPELPTFENGFLLDSSAQVSNVLNFSHQSSVRMLVWPSLS